MDFLGIDVVKDKLDVHLLTDGGADKAEFANHKSDWRSQATAVHICLEATGRYGEGVTAYLHQQGYTLSVVNPARIKAYASSRLTRNKTDQLDAALIADSAVRNTRICPCGPHRTLLNINYKPWYASWKTWTRCVSKSVTACKLEKIQPLFSSVSTTILPFWMPRLNPSNRKLTSISTSIPI